MTIELLMPNIRIGCKFQVPLATFTPPKMFQALITVAPAAGREPKMVASMPVFFSPDVLASFELGLFPSPDTTGNPKGISSFSPALSR